MDEEKSQKITTSKDPWEECFRKWLKYVKIFVDAVDSKWFITSISSLHWWWHMRYICFKFNSFRTTGHRRMMKMSYFHWIILTRLGFCRPLPKRQRNCSFAKTLKTFFSIFVFQSDAIDIRLIAMRYEFNTLFVQHCLNGIFALWLLKLYDNFPLHFTRCCAIAYKNPFVGQFIQKKAFIQSYIKMWFSFIAAPPTKKNQK